MTSSASTVPSQTKAPPQLQPQSVLQKPPNITELSSGDVECSDVIGTYDAPLDQPINEFLEQEHGIVLQSSKLYFLLILPKCSTKNILMLRLFLCDL